MKDGFHYRDGALYADAVPLDMIADAVATPCWVYSARVMRARLRRLQEALAGLNAKVFYAIKANDSVAVIKTLAETGAGAEIVSGGELQRAQAAGVPGEDILFAGVAKSQDEIAAALRAGIRQLNVESLPELHSVAAVARTLGVTAPVAFRVNPDVEAGTHEKISTGRKQDKFGIAYDEALAAYRTAASLPGVAPVGVHLHIGSQIGAVTPFERAYRRAADLVRTLRDEGIALRQLDLGGGFGIAYADDQASLDLRDYGAVVRRTVGDLGLALFVEPGRYLVAEAGVLVTRTIYLKQNGERRFVIVDAGMNDLLRPAMYQAHHPIWPLRQPLDAAEWTPHDVVGPICESSDVFARARPLPPLAEGDRLALTHAGAYGAVMSSHYNARPMAAAVLVDGARWAVTRPRIEPAAFLAEERLPAWLRSEVDQPTLID